MLGSMQDIIVIAVVALIVVGPKKLPEMAKTLGRAFTEFKKATEGITDEFKDALKEETKPQHSGMGMADYITKEEPKPEQPEASENASHEETKTEQPEQPEYNDALPPTMTAPNYIKPAEVKTEEIKTAEPKSEETTPKAS
jgi:TatA/E family protein of Tat protein translocase